MGCPAVRHAFGVPLDPVVEPEPGAAELAAPHADLEDVVERGRALVLDVDAGRERLDPAFPNRRITACERGKIRDPRLLEPDDERRVVRDPLRVRLREADAYGMRERVAVHQREIYPALRCRAWGPRPISRR